MRSRHFLLSLIILQLAGLIAYAEELSLNDDSSEWLCALEEIDNPEEYQDLVSNLESASDLPVNILTADIRELQSIPWISPSIARKVVDLRRRGNLSCLDDLRMIEGLSPRVIDLIRPFVKFEKPGSTESSLRCESRFRLVGQLPSEDISDLGCYFMGQFEKKSIRAGFIMEKDRGERKFNDFQSGFIEIKRTASKILIGDYYLAVGHGLIFGTSYRTSPEFVNPNRLASGDFSLKPHTGVDENRYLRGVGIIAGKGKFRAIGALSSKRVDARLDQSGRIQSLLYGGYHITDTELAARKRVRSNLGALVVGFDWCRFRIGAALASLRFDHVYAQPQRFGFKNNQAILQGLNIWLDLDDVIFFGEIARSNRGDPAWLMGLTSQQGRNQMVLIGRSYPANYLSPNGRPFSFYSDLSEGESGLFALARVAFPRLATLTLANDLHRRAAVFDQPRSSGSQSLINLKIDFHDISVAMEGKLTRSEARTDASATKDQQRLRTRIDLSYSSCEWLDLKLRFEKVEAKTYELESQKKSQGEVLRVSIGSRWRSTSVVSGFYVFNVEDYDSRSYQVEPGLPYYPTTTVLNRDGSRWYITFTLDRSRRSILSVKLATTEGRGFSSRREILCFYGIRTR
ncbi:MAG: ComEA family DNA-binding protein [bacterium]